VGSAKTPENVSTDFSLMVIGSFFAVPSETRIARQPFHQREHPLQIDRACSQLRACRNHHARDISAQFCAADWWEQRMPYPGLDFLSQYLFRATKTLHGPLFVGSGLDPGSDPIGTAVDSGNGCCGFR
jgi:hypothetical protein